MATVPYKRPDCPYWLRKYVQSRKITPEVADHLLCWIDNFSGYLECLETEKVYYRAIAGETDEAIEAFAKLMRSVVTNAHKQNDKTMRGYCREQLLLDESKELQSRVMTYLPELLDDPRDKVRLQDVVREVGWSRKAD